jgi:chaperonin GroES
MFMKVKPLGDRVLVKLQYAEEKTAGGIIIPDTAQEKTQTGVVLAVGDDESIKVKAKDKIMYDKYAGTTIKVNGEEQLILKMSDIIAKVED